jgi:hypothetical protein
MRKIRRNSYPLITLTHKSSDFYTHNIPYVMSHRQFEPKQESTQSENILYFMWIEQS